MISRASRPWRSDLVEIAVIFAVFCVQGAWPVPDVNEPYYLGKAIHYWNPDWVRGDFFLDSADAHWVFYFAFGWLGLLLSPPVLTWVGRVLTWGLLAWSWQRLSRAVVPRRGMAVLSGALFACLMDRCHMAGEWVIGGLEAKGFAYVLVFLGLEAMVRDRWNRAWLLWGGASLLHVVAGGWVVVAAGLTWLASGRTRPPLRSMWPGLLGGLAISLPSLIPLLALNAGVDPKTAVQAHEIYVYYRLPHHLILQEFSPKLLVRFAVLVVIWALLCLASGREGPQRRLRWFVFGALAIASIGAVLSLTVSADRVLGARLLRFYWFRLSDVAVPMGVAVFAAGLIVRLLSWRRALGALGLAVASAVAVLHAGEYAWLRLEPTVPRADLKVDKLGGYVAWRDACQWIVSSGVIPEDARFLTPIDASTFKWRTRRAEVVTRKEIPQDAASIVIWWERLRRIHGIGPDEPKRYWHASLAELGEKRLQELGAEYGAGYVLTEAPGIELPETDLDPKRTVPRLDLKTLYRNDGYIVYQLDGPGQRP